MHKVKSIINEINGESDIDKINKYTIKKLGESDVYTFKVQLCDNDVDRVGDKMSNEFLDEVAKNIVGLTGLKDHDWSSDNQSARLYDAEVVIDDKLTRTGENRRYVLGKAYTLSKYKDYIDKINAGILKETSISFDSIGDKCSICGEEMVKDEYDVGHCCNGHCAGEIYDGELCYNSITKLKDLLEWSLVAVPCQRQAGVSSKSLGGNVMRKAEYLIRQFMSSKAYKNATEEDKNVIKEVLDTSNEDNKELTDDEIKAVIDENAKLKEKIKSLEDKVKEVDGMRTRDKMDSIVDKAMDNLGLITPDVKDLLKKEIPWDDLKLEDGQIPGLDNVFAGMKDKYKGLFVNESDIEEVGGHDEPDGDEAAVIDVRDKGEPDGDEGKVMVVDDRHSKGVNKPSGGITFGATQKAYNSNGNKSKVKPGIYF